MILWALALILLVCLGTVGYYQGAIRAGFSLVGLLLAAVLAGPLAFVFKGILPVFGLKHPAVLAFVAPALMYLLILILFKSTALVVHKKVDTHYKYQDSDTRRMLFERLNQRLGLCLGLANAAVYFFLLCVVFSVLGYLTVQVASSDKDSFALRWSNRFADSLQKTGMDRAVAPFHPGTEFYFDAVDIVGSIYHTPLLQGSLSSYPVFLTLAEKSEFKALGNDLTFQKFWQEENPTVGGLMNHERVRPLIDDVDLYTNVVAMLGGNLKDLKGYLDTGKSEKYDDEKILGHWDFDYKGALALAKQKTPNMGTLQLRVVRAALGRLNNAKFTATLDNKAVLKIPSTNNVVTLTGTWKNDGGKYSLQFADGGKKWEADARIEAQKRLIFSKDSYGLVFEK